MVILVAVVAMMVLVVNKRGVRKKRKRSVEKGVRSYENHHTIAIWSKEIVLKKKKGTG